MASAMDDLAGFTRTLAAAVAQGGPDVPGQIGALCVASLPVTGAAITVMSGPDHQDPVWASDAVAARLDELQFRLAEGPCIQAFTSRRPVLIADIRDDTDHRVAHWPMFTAAARDTTARGIYVLPLQDGAVRVGVLDFYCDEPGALGDDDLNGALRAADGAFWALLGWQAGRRLDLQGAPLTDPAGAGWLAGAPLERREVYQATGMLIAQLDVEPDTALARLRAYAFLHDQAIDAVARDVISQRIHLDDYDDGDEPR